MSRPLLPFGIKGKTVHIDRFRGLDAGAMRAGQLLDADCVEILAGGALRSVAGAERLPIAETPVLDGVYTLCPEYDADYEIPVSTAWVYANVCPAEALGYTTAESGASRLLIRDVGLAGKQDGRYRSLLGAFRASGRIHVLYASVYTVIHHRRTQDYEKYSGGTLSQFLASAVPSGTSKICTLTQLWMDVIDSGHTESLLVDATLTPVETIPTADARATLVKVDGGEFHYVTDDYLPQIGGSYTGHTDKVYADYYARAAEYPVVSTMTAEARRVVACYNRIPGEGELGAIGAHSLLLPDMRLLHADGTLSAPIEGLPRMTAAVQHLDRLFGIAGNRLYASTAGNCADFTTADGASAAWETVTPDGSGFTAILSFDGRVVAFTESSMLTVRGNELPFSLSCEGAWGCPRAEAAVTLGGWLYFASGGDVLRYNGSRVESIGQGLPRGLDLAHAALGTDGGSVLLGAYGFDGVLLYDPQSGCWTARHGAVADAFFDGFYLAGGNAWRTGKETGPFSAAVTLGCGERRRIHAVTVTAFLARDSLLTLHDARGQILWRAEGMEEGLCTRTFPAPSVLCAEEPFFLGGTGDVTVYHLAAHYAPTRT